MADKKSACCCDVTTEWLKIDPGCCAENRFDRSLSSVSHHSIAYSGRVAEGLPRCQTLQLWR